LEKTEANNALWFRSSVSLADGERVGAFNAGFVGLLLLPNPVVNLDGFANDDIQGDLLGRVGAWPSPTLADYISRERIHYVIDHVPQWTEWKTVVGLNPELLKNTEAISPSVGSRWYYVVRFVAPLSSQGATSPEPRTTRRAFPRGQTRLHLQ